MRPLPDTDGSAAETSKPFRLCRLFDSMAAWGGIAEILGKPRISAANIRWTQLASQLIARNHGVSPRGNAANQAALVVCAGGQGPRRTQSKGEGEGQRLHSAGGAGAQPRKGNRWARRVPKV